MALMKTISFQCLPRGQLSSALVTPFPAVLSGFPPGKTTQIKPNQGKPGTVS